VYTFVFLILILILILKVRIFLKLKTKNQKKKILEKFVCVMYMKRNEVCVFYLKNKCKYTDEMCKFLHMSNDEFKEKRHKEQEQRLIDEKIYKEQKIQEEIVKKELRFMKDSCICVEFSFDISKQEDWGSGIDDDDDEMIHYDNLVKYIWVPQKYFPDGITPTAIEQFTKLLHSFTRFGSFCNFVGAGAAGKITVKNMYELKVGPEPCEYKSSSSFLYNVSGKYVDITDGLTLPDSYCSCRA